VLEAFQTHTEPALALVLGEVLAVIEALAEVPVDPFGLFGLLMLVDHPNQCSDPLLLI
jgi:hypothetical protein